LATSRLSKKKISRKGAKTQRKKENQKIVIYAYVLKTRLSKHYTLATSRLSEKINHEKTQRKKSQLSKKHLSLKSKINTEKKFFILFFI